jgi:hypothetical protein
MKRVQFGTLYLVYLRDGERASAANNAPVEARGLGRVSTAAFLSGWLFGSNGHG